jgi:phosphoribosylanthranilate isomerase
MTGPEPGTKLRKGRPCPQVKICGLTRTEEAVSCAELGADAIGCVFYPASPRNVSRSRARAIVRALPEGVTPVGVFVDASFSTIMETVEDCGLRAAQLHGAESPELVEKLLRKGVPVIKALFVDGSPSVRTASRFRARAFLVECARGKLPGGNALTWNWEAARPTGEKFPLVLAGGLDPENVIRAIEAARPDAVDVSSGVESAPGRKDPGKVAAFMGAVRRAPMTLNNETTRRIF